MMNLKTSKVPAIELGISNLSNSDLELKGTEALRQYNSSLIPPESDISFKNLFGFDCNFFYKVDLITNNKVTKSEYGIGHLISSGDSVILKRELPMYLYSNDRVVPCHNGPHHFITEGNDYLTIYSTTPSSYIELLANSNCVIASSEPFSPSPIPVENNSLLGRLDDNVQSIPFSSLFSHPELIAAILEVITTYSKQLSLRTSKLDAKKISTDSLQLNTNDKLMDKKGTLGFDGKNLKFYDGEVWRVLEWSPNSR